MCGGEERRIGKGERVGPPSLGSQPLNQALSHPVNLKQSGFNSSCLSVPAKSGEARLAGADRPRPRWRRNRADRRGDAPEDTSHTNTPLSLYPPLLSFSLSIPLFLSSFTAHDGTARSLGSPPMSRSRIALIEFALFTNCLGFFFFFFSTHAPVSSFAHFRSWAHRSGWTLSLFWL